MRVATGRATQSDSRMFTVVVEGFGIGQQRQAERNFTVPFSQLQPTMQTIALQGGRITAVKAAGSLAADSAPATPSAAAEAPAPSAAPSPPPNQL